MTKKTGSASYMISVVAQKYNIHPQTLRLYLSLIHISEPTRPY